MPLGRLPSASVFTTSALAALIRSTLSENSFVTQTTFLPTATPRGPSPTRTVAVTVFVCASIRDTVPSSSLATQMKPPPDAIPVGPPPTLSASPRRREDPPPDFQHR